MLQNKYNRLIKGQIKGQSVAILKSRPDLENGCNFNSSLDLHEGGGWVVLNILFTLFSPDFFSSMISSLNPDLNPC